MDGTAYIGLGSNLGDRLGFLCEALALLESRGLRPVIVSRLYETAPMYVTDQPPFLNAAAKLKVACDPEALLAELGDVETMLGRRRERRFGPRTIDLDILLWGADGRGVRSEPHLAIPHPRLLERAFVLIPLAEIAGSVVHPLCERPIAELAELADRRGVVLFSSWGWFEGGQ